MREGTDADDNNDERDNGGDQSGSDRRARGRGLTGACTQIFREHELRERALTDDSRISDSFRREQIQAIEDETDRALRAARDRDVAAAMKDHDAHEGAILAQIKGTATKNELSIETGDERAERHARASLAATTLLTDILVTQSLSDPSALADVLEEALESGRADRIERLAPIVIGRLSELQRHKQPGADGALVAVSAAWASYRKNHPTLISQLREVRAAKREVERPIDRKYQRARDHFALGAAKHGIRM